MVRPIRFRFWFETVVALLVASSSIFILIAPRWIEDTLGWTTGWAGRRSWIIAAALLVVAILLLLIARHEWRRARSRAPKPRVTVGEGGPHRADGVDASARAPIDGKPEGEVH